MKRISNFDNYRLGIKIDKVNLSVYGNDVEYSLYVKNIHSKKIYFIASSKITNAGIDPYSEFTEYGWGIDKLPLNMFSQSIIDSLHNALENDDYETLEKFYLANEDVCEKAVTEFYISEYEDLDYDCEIPVINYCYNADFYPFEYCVEDFDSFDEDICWYNFSKSNISHIIIGNDCATIYLNEVDSDDEE